MQAITSPRNGYCIPRVSYIAVTTGCDSTDGVDASASSEFFTYDSVSDSTG